MLYQAVSIQAKCLVSIENFGSMVDIEKNDNAILIYPEEIKKQNCNTRFQSYGYIMYFKSKNEPGKTKMMRWKDNIHFTGKDFLKNETITLTDIQQQLFEVHDNRQVMTNNSVILALIRFEYLSR